LRVTRDLRAVGDLAAGVLARAAPATRLETLEDVLQFGFAQRPGWELVEIVVQDEFTHDVIIAIGAIGAIGAGGAGAAPGFLVFDTT
jgi:hypothetical protein